MGVFLKRSKKIKKLEFKATRLSFDGITDDLRPILAKGLKEAGFDSSNFSEVLVSRNNLKEFRVAATFAADDGKKVILYISFPSEKLSFHPEPSYRIYFWRPVIDTETQNSEVKMVFSSQPADITSLKNCIESANHLVSI